MKVVTSPFVRKKGTPLYVQIYEKLKTDILNGYLKKGDRMPSIRACEALFKVSKTSVEHAYARLLEEGYIRSKPKAGYVVDVDDEHIRMRRTLFQEDTTQPPVFLRYDFRSQSMDRDAFDLTLWKKYLKEALDQYPQISTYGDAQGERSLRQALQRYAYSQRGVLCDVDAMIIGASFQSLLFLLCAMLDHSLIVGMEEGSFAQAETVFASYGFPIQKLTLRKDGVSITELKEKKIQLLYVNAGSQGSDHQPLSRKKKDALLAWAKETSALIIEDDHNGELRYVSKPASSMQGYDMGEHVVYIGSFSRVLLPSLRISYLVMTKNLIQCYEKRKSSLAPTAGKIEQLALARYLTDGHLERHVKRLTKRYERKSAHMNRLLKTYFPEAAILLEEASLQYLLRFQHPIQSEELLDQANALGIALSINHAQDLVISFAAIAEDEMEAAIQQLSTIVHTMEETHRTNIFLISGV